MINLILFLVLLACAGITAAWLAENPGEVTMVWAGWRIDTSLAGLLIAMALAAFVLAYAVIIVRAIIRAPGQWRAGRSERVYRRSLAEVTYSVAALAASDITTAERHARKAQKLIGRTPLTLLLQAQIARSRGDDDKTRSLLESMLDHKETEYLAARSLAESASQNRHLPQALELAQRAMRLSPRDASAAEAVISLHLRMGAWQEALAAVQTSARKGRWPRAKMLRARALVHLMQGRQLLETGETELALAHAKLCLKSLPGFAPVAVFAARAFAAAGRPEKAIKLLLAAWKHEPHPEIAGQLRLITSREPKERQIKWAKKLAAQQPGHRLSQLALAETAIKLQDWALARGALTSALEQGETVQACKLMAYLEQGEFSDADAAGRWLAKSSDAPADGHWQCAKCHHIGETWDAHCPACQAYDSLVWKTAS